jgi:uracil-DNA glycosylase family 4
MRASETALERLEREIPACSECSRLAGFLASLRTRHPDSWNRPVPGFGDRAAWLVIVGLAPGMHGANRTGRPFPGDYAGILLYESLHALGLASAPVSVHRKDGLKLHGVRITNAVKCLPPGNKPLPAEVQQCNRYLERELSALRPGSVVVALGVIAHGAVLRACGLRPAAGRFAHGAEHRLPGPLVLLDSFHCSRLNTNTGRLTPAMFNRVFARARHLIGA